METHRFRYKSAMAKLRYYGDGIYSLTDLEADERNQGHATGVLKQVCRFADSQDWPIILVAQPYGRNEDVLELPALERFYKKFGFEITAKRPTRMIRYPRKTHLEEDCDNAGPDLDPPSNGRGTADGGGYRAIFV